MPIAAILPLEKTLLFTRVTNFNLVRFKYFINGSINEDLPPELPLKSKIKVSMLLSCINFFIFWMSGINLSVHFGYLKINIFYFI